MRIIYIAESLHHTAHVFSGYQKQIPAWKCDVMPPHSVCKHTGEDMGMSVSRKDYTGQVKIVSPLKIVIWTEAPLTRWGNSLRWLLQRLSSIAGKSIWVEGANTLDWPVTRSLLRSQYSIPGKDLKMCATISSVALCRCEHTWHRTFSFGPCLCT